MKYVIYSLTVLLLFSAHFGAQGRVISLEEIWNGTFRKEGIDVLHSMKNGKQYSVLNFDTSSKSTSIDVYDYQTRNKINTLINARDVDGLKNFSDYSFSEDETKIILATDERSIYRYSSKGVYYVYDIINESLTQISEENIQEPTFSPDGTKVGFVFNNNLFVKNLQDHTTAQITFDGEKNKIINGITDWVYEEEFAFVKAFEWNADSDQIAFIKFDETNVPEFSMDVYGTGLYPTEEVFKYPKAGEENSKVSVHVYDVNTSKTSTINVDNTFDDFYIPKIKWANQPNKLYAIYLNRLQNEAHIWAINTSDNDSKIMLIEKDETYIKEGYDIHFLKDDSFLWLSEKDGYNHIYHYDQNGKLINQVTKGNWDVTEYYGYDEKGGRVFYQSVENGSINRDVYSVKLDGRDKLRLTKKQGTNNAAFSANFSYFINTFSSASNPPEYTLNSASSGKVLANIKDNEVLARKMVNYVTSKKEFSTIAINGYDLNMWMIKPVNFDADKEYPLLMYQYSGPGSQEVSNSWNTSNDYWFQHLAQQGYIIACVDGRGTGYKGAAFKKITYMELGKYELEDQIEAAKQLGRLPYIDDERIGIWGWSFGGYISSNALFKGNDIFKTAIAVAPVTNWRFYNTVYTERFMRTPQENANGYDDNSPINFADKLKGNYLLIHGSADDNVHLQNTMRLVEALIQDNKQFDWAIYPDDNHGIYGGNTRLHLYKKMTNFINQHLGDRLEKNIEGKKEKYELKG